MARICPLMSNGTEGKDCIGENCALWMDLSLSSNNKEFKGCAFLVIAEKN